MSDLTVVVLILVALALFVAVIAALAPEGWQDAAGFHVGRVADVVHDNAGGAK